VGGAGVLGESIRLAIDTAGGGALHVHALLVGYSFVGEGVGSWHLGRGFLFDFAVVFVGVAFVLVVEGIFV
jgi:hypothetical protein